MGTVPSVKRLMCCIVGIGLLALSPIGHARVNRCRCALTERDRATMVACGRSENNYHQAEYHRRRNSWRMQHGEDEPKSAGPSRKTEREKATPIRGHTSTSSKGFPMVLS